MASLKNAFIKTQVFSFAAAAVNPIIITCPAGFHIWVVGFALTLFSSITVNRFEDAAGLVLVLLTGTDTTDSAKQISNWKASHEGIRLTNNSNFRNTTASANAGTGFAEYFFEAN